MRLLLIIPSSLAIWGLFLGSFHSLHAQSSQLWEIGGMAGATVYHGDLAPDFSFQAPGAAASVFLRRNLDSRLSLRLGASFASISASDSKSENSFRKARNLSFQSTIFEGSICAEFNFLPFHHKSRRGEHNQFTPYLMAGVGVFYHNPKTLYKGKVYELQALGTEGQKPGEEYSLVQPAFIIGGGFKIDLNRQWGIVIEGATRILFFDYLDDVSGEYAAPQTIEANRGSLGTIAANLADRSGEIGQNMGSEGRQRGNANTNDGYTMFTVGVVYTIYNGSNCPTH